MGAARPGLLVWAKSLREVPRYLLRDDGQPVSSKNPSQGPGGGGGVLVSPCSGQAFSLDYEPEEQAWTETGLGYWVGIDPRGTIAPEALERDTMCSGHEVRLGDGEWVIPAARLVAGGTHLPQRRRLRDGKLCWEVEESHAELSAAADRIWDALMAGEAVVNDEELDAAIDAALRINYRVGVTELAVADLLPIEAVREMAGALIDLPTIRRLEAEMAAGKPGPAA